MQAVNHKVRSTTSAGKGTLWAEFLQSVTFMIHLTINLCPSEDKIFFFFFCGNFSHNISLIGFQQTKGKFLTFTLFGRLVS